MIVQTTSLSEDGRYGFTLYAQDESPEIATSHRRPMVVVCPGGGYQMTSDREAEPIALAYLAAGFHAAVVRYPVGADAAWPNSLVCLSKAIRMIREQADRFRIDPQQIAVCGFSAGGHLVASLGVHWDDPDVCAAAECPNGENRPNALILGYPVITTDPSFTHEGTIMTLLQQIADPAECARKRTWLSCEKHVAAGKTPPTFLFHTSEDSCVPVRNMLVFAEMLASNGIPFEAHVYEKGVHGLALADYCTYANPSTLNREVASWMRHSCDWLWNLFGHGV